MQQRAPPGPSLAALKPEPRPPARRGIRRSVPADPPLPFDGIDVEAWLRGQNAELTSLHDMTLGLLERRDFHGLLEAIVARAGALLQSPHAFLSLREDGRDDLIVRAAAGKLGPSVGLRIPAGESVTDRVCRTGRAVALDDVRALPHPCPALASTRAVVCVPLRIGAETVGVLGVAHVDDHRRFTPREVELAERFARTASLALENAWLHASTGRELAERRRAERALRRSNESLRVLFARNPHPMWIYDQTTLRFVEVNDAAVARYGHSRDEFLAMTLLDIRPVEEVPRLLSSLAGGRPPLEASGDWRHRLKDGTVIDVDIASHTIDWEGRECVMVVAFDVTDRKQAERIVAETLERERRAHGESERRAALLATVARAARGMSSLRTEDVLDVVVGSVLALGFDASDLCLFDDAKESYLVVHGHGLPPGYAGTRHPVGVGMAGKVLGSGGTVVVNDYASDPDGVPLLRRAGFKAVVATPVWSNGAVVGVLAGGSMERSAVTRQDVEAFELLAAQASRGLDNARRFQAERRAVSRLAELDRLKDDFLSTISHELRTPLTVIEGTGRTLSERWDLLDAETRTAFFERLSANTRTLDNLVESLLDFSRLQAGRLTVHPEPVELDALLDGVLRRMGSLLHRHALTWTIEANLVVIGDPMLLDRVVENLLSNAAKHTPAGTKVRVEACREGPEAVVVVADEGPGISSEDLPHIGDRFFRGGTTNTRKTRGVGLGLALARDVLRSHGSELEVANAADGGARFAFRLPLAAAQAS